MFIESRVKGGNITLNTQVTSLPNQVSQNMDMASGRG
jgi:hypothetical protein